MGSVGPKYGKILGYDFISEKPVKDYLVKRIYTLKFENTLLVFTFLFYFNGTGWKINNFDYTHETDALFR